MDVSSILFSNTLKIYFLWETIYYIACFSDKFRWVIWNNLKIYFINFLACTTPIQYTFINYIYQHLFLSYMQYLSNFLFNCILSCFLLVIKLFSIEICSMSSLYIQCKFIIKCQRKCKLYFRISINISHLFHKCYPSVQSNYIWKFLFILYVKIWPIYFPYYRYISSIIFCNTFSWNFDKYIDIKIQLTRKIWHELSK